jgi:hypothetical protein
MLNLICASVACKGVAITLVLASGLSRLSVINPSSWMDWADADNDVKNVKIKLARNLDIEIDKRKK